MARNSRAERSRRFRDAISARGNLWVCVLRVPSSGIVRGPKVKTTILRGLTFFDTYRMRDFVASHVSQHTASQRRLADVERCRPTALAEMGTVPNCYQHATRCLCCLVRRDKKGDFNISRSVSSESHCLVAHFMMVGLS